MLFSKLAALRTPCIAVDPDLAIHINADQPSVGNKHQLTGQQDEARPADPAQEIRLHLWHFRSQLKFYCWEMS